MPHLQTDGAGRRRRWSQSRSIGSMIANSRVDDGEWEGTRKHAGDVCCRLCLELSDRCLGVEGGVRRHDSVVESEQRMIVRRRLLAKNVERCTRDPVLLKGSMERVFI